MDNSKFLKMGHSRPLFFLYCRLFNTVNSKEMFNINFVDDWIQKVDLWNRKHPLYQLSHNPCPKDHSKFIKLILWIFYAHMGLQQAPFVLDFQSNEFPVKKSVITLPNLAIQHLKKSCLMKLDFD